MNKKGFTLIEMLTVVIILGILLALAVPSITSYLKKGTSEYYSGLEESIKLAAKDYTTEYRQLLPKVIGNVTIIDLSELTDNDYISNVVDSNGKSCTATVTVEKTSKNEYEYYTCLSCEDYKTEDENVKACSFSENNNVTEDTKNYTIEVTNDSKYEIDTNGNYIVDQGEEFTLPNAKAYKNNELVNDNVEPSPKTIDTNKLGTTIVTYVYKGQKTEITVTVVDRVAPSIPQVVLREDNSKGNIYNGGWYNNNIYQEFLSTDYSKEGIVGSGIARYEISTDGETFYEITGNYNVTNDSFETGEYTYYVRSVDSNGNVSDINTYSFKLDKIDPKAEITVNKKIATITLTDNIGVVAYGVSNSNSTQPTYTTIGTTTNTTVNWEAKKAGTYYAWVKDVSGRTSYTEFEIPKNAFCDFPVGKTWVFGSANKVQQFTAQCEGTYKLEVYGAQGGTNGGYGGYSYGQIFLTIDTKLYVVVGGYSEYGSGGYNGGGSGGMNDGGDRRGAGGGATHIATTNYGVLKNYSSHQNDVLIVAGGGGGGTLTAGGSHTSTSGGSGGGKTGGSGGITDRCCMVAGNYFESAAGGGTQYSGGSGGKGRVTNWSVFKGADGSFGQGANGTNWQPGGGGGWYGGGAAGVIDNHTAGGGGGSGYINTSRLNSYGMSNGAKSGSGLAIITLMQLAD